MNHVVIDIFENIYKGGWHRENWSGAWGSNQRGQWAYPSYKLGFHCSAQVDNILIKKRQ